jgi:hypothetical protein
VDVAKFTASPGLSLDDLKREAGSLLSSDWSMVSMVESGVFPWLIHKISIDVFGHEAGPTQRVVKGQCHESDIFFKV